MKKFVALLFCYLACAIYFGHSIIPHNHHPEHSSEDHDHNHDNESDNQSIFDLFAHFGQSGEAFTPQIDQEINISKNFECNDGHITLLREINLPVNYTLLPDFFGEPYIFISPHLTSFHFRGPPVII